MTYSLIFSKNDFIFLNFHCHFYNWSFKASTLKSPHAKSLHKIINYLEEEKEFLKHTAVKYYFTPTGGCLVSRYILTKTEDTGKRPETEISYV